MTEETKNCHTCREDKCVSEYAVTKTGKLKRSCKVCLKAWKDNWNEKNAEANKAAKLKSYHKRKTEREIPAHPRVCTKCNVLKESSDFYQVRTQCRACTNIEYREYVDKNREHLTAYHNEYYRNNAERSRETSNKWKAQNKDKVSAYARAQRKRSAARLAAKCATRRARKLKATPTWANKNAIQKFYDTAQGLGMLLGEWYHVDHIVPLQSDFVCGLHCESNLRVITAEENLSKNNRWWPDMWTSSTTEES